MRFEKHIFICNNQKAPGKECCGENRGNELVALFKEKLRERGLNGIVRAQRTGCLDACSHGPSMVVYPEGIFYGRVTPEDVDRIIEQHIIGNKPIEELIINF